MKHIPGSKRPILVTGSPRSGSTWVGRMLALSPTVLYLNEPFNPKHNAGLCGAEFQHFYTYITAENEGDYYETVKKTVELSYDLWSALKAAEDVRSLAMYIREWRRFWTSRIKDATPLFKDPIAIFSSEWLAHRFNMQVVTIVRHPAAYIASKKKANWRVSFTSFLEQPLLMENYLYPFEDDIRKHAQEPRCIVEEGILVWRMIYHVIAKFQEKHQDWIFIRHEDLSRKPVVEFGNLYSKLGLKYTGKIKAKVSQYSLPQQRGRSSLQNIQRDSRENIWAWKQRLTAAEIEQIKVHTDDIAKNFYSEEDW